MRFSIERTSQQRFLHVMCTPNIYRFDENDPPPPPVKGAVWEKSLLRDERTGATPEEVPHYAGESPAWWYGYGENHRVENGHIVRDIPEFSAFITLYNLDELLQLSNREGEPIIVTGSDDPSVAGHLEIYDDYRE